MVQKKALPSVTLARALQFFERWIGPFLTTDAHQAIPQGLRYYVVGDIHGRADLLNQIQQQISADLIEHPVDQAIEVYLGDYIDRGPSSREVIENLATPTSDGRQRICLMGNHESLLLDFLADSSVLNRWKQVGGLETLQSYGIARPTNETDATTVQSSLRAAMPPHHLHFLRTLEIMDVGHGHAFVHAGVRPGVPLDGQSEEDCLWIREEFLDYAGSFGARIIHGHTPQDKVDVRPNRINIDTGAYITGVLTCLILGQEGQRLLQTA
ncbi:metallophosphoesterase [uncultured Roseibium sp.]|uniref:metallophosphoesterase n=1 Tax=uncultured Roseibium sp. TaxID=1936171 RepID=UPI00259686AF|nr:metallophosphoesterase [uncultured Roseibium sp.]